MQDEPWLPSDKPQGQKQVRIEDLVRPWVDGMTTLVISNRMDPDLERRLSERLGLDITWAICDMRRAQAQAKAISNRKYDLVIGQTGFLSHNIETIIARACNANGVPYIRAEKARPTSTAMALIRDLGLDITKEPPKSDTIRTSAPPQTSSDGTIRRRTIVMVPQRPEDYKDLDIDVLKFLEGQSTYFRLEDLMRSMRGIPIILESSGMVNWTKMRIWTNAIGAILRRLNYVNAQLPPAVDPKRPRVWVRRDRQSHLRIEGMYDDDRTPAEISRQQEQEQEQRQQPQPPRPRQPVRSAPRPSGGRSRKTRTAEPIDRPNKWLKKYDKAIRAYAKDKLYVHPEDIIRMLGVDLPPTRDIRWQYYQFWTKNCAQVLRKMGFMSRQREFGGFKARVWIHKKAPRYLYVSGPGTAYVGPATRAEASRAPATRPSTPARQPTPRPVAQAPAPTPIRQEKPMSASTIGPKTVRISFSSISGGDMQELLLVLTQAGWAVSFGP